MRDHDDDDATLGQDAEGSEGPGEVFVKRGGKLVRVAIGPKTATIGGVSVLAIVGGLYQLSTSQVSAIQSSADMRAVKVDGKLETILERLNSIEAGVNVRQLEAKARVRELEFTIERLEDRLSKDEDRLSAFEGKLERLPKELREDPWGGQEERTIWSLFRALNPELKIPDVDAVAPASRNPR